MQNSLDTAAALNHFKAHDPVMHGLLMSATTAALPLALPSKKQPAEYFSSIASSIISQQISTKAAEAVRGRVAALVGSLTPDAINAADETALRACGLSGQKLRYLKHNAAIWHTLPVDSFEAMSDEEVIAALTTLYGVGRWTAEMFLIFSLARPDVFSRGDLGLMQSLYQHYAFRPHYVRKINTLIERWSPHRTSAALTLWYVRDNGPVLL